MASGGLRELAEDLLCPVCMEELERPKVLQCKHVFCAGCLEQLYKRKKLQCPVCRADIHLDEGKGIEDLPEPLILTQLQEKIKQLYAEQDDSRVPELCGYCPKRATNICQTCIKRLCDCCTRKHRGNMLTKTHPIVYISPWTICKSHQGEMISGFCKECQSGLCIVCAQGDHCDHQMVDINDAQLLQESTAQLETIRTNSTRPKPDITSRKKDADARMETIKKQYKISYSHLEKVRRNINEVVDGLHKKMKEQMVAEKKKMMMFIDETDDAATAEESLKSFIDDILSRNCSTEIVMASAHLPKTQQENILTPPNMIVPSIKNTKRVIDSVEEMLVLSPITSFQSAVDEDSCHDKEETMNGNTLRHAKTAKSVAKFRPLWEHKMGLPGEHINDLAWDNEVPHGWWVRSDRGLEKPGFLTKICVDGSIGGRINNIVTHGWGRLCISSKSNLLVSTDNKKKLLCLSREGNLVKEIVVKNSGRLAGVAYCAGSDTYIVSDTGSNAGDGKHQLWFISAQSGQVMRQIGSKKGGQMRFDWPSYVYHHNCDTGCQVLVSDSNNNCVKAFTCTGEFKRKFGSLGSGAWQLKAPHGLCADRKGGIIVCDAGNRRVVRWGDQKWDVLLNSEQLGVGIPISVDLAADNRHLLVSLAGRQVFVKCYTYII